jgi:hypothetical protein
MAAGPPLNGWQRAYVEWVASHGDDLRSVAHAMHDVPLQQFLLSLLASAVEAGWKGAELVPSSSPPHEGEGNPH